MRFDHIAIAAETLQAGVDYVEAALGVSMGPGGKHARFGTHNALLGLDRGLYLEVIAPDPEAAPFEGPRWFGLDQFTGPPRPANWICAVPDLDRAIAEAPVPCGRAVALERGDLRWRMAVPEDGSMPLNGAWPTMIEWRPGMTPPGQSLPDSGVRLIGWEVTLQHPSRLARSLPMGDPRVTLHKDRGALVPRFTARLETPRGLVELSS